ncbi:MAG: hypothetical protein Q8Q05_02355 [bacterium]|nr:hypothetical protein [bacterium]
MADLYQVAQSRFGLEHMVESARLGLTPDGESQANVLALHPEDEAEILCCFVSPERLRPNAAFAGREPRLLREEPSLKFEFENGASISITRGYYVLYDPTVVFCYRPDVDFSPIYYYILVHSDFEPMNYDFNQKVECVNDALKVRRLELRR